MERTLKKYSCRVCVKTGAMNRRFKEKSDCFTHYIACHYSKGEDTTYVKSDNNICQTCSEQLKYLGGLMQHRRDKHGEDPDDEDGPWVIHDPPTIQGKRSRRRRRRKKQASACSGVNNVLGQMNISNLPSSDYFNKPVVQYGSSSVGGAASFSSMSGSLRQGAMIDSPRMEDSFLKSCTDLNSFLETKIVPTTEENTLLGLAMDALASFLKEQMPLSVKKVEKGGSAGKGTVVKDKSDLDVVVFLNDFKNMSQFEKTIENKKLELKNVLKKHGIQGGHKVTVEGTTRFAIKIKLTPANMDRAIDMDVLPAYDNLNIHGKPQTYQNMRKYSSSREFYSSSLVKLQVDFTKSQPAAVKNLIRLVKFWRKTHFKERSDKANGLPSSYPLELLTINCWEKAGSPERFEMAQGLKAVLQALANFTNIKCKWETNYKLSDYQEEIRQLELTAGKLKPLILDPANPFNNTADRAGAWQEVADMAEDGLRSTCLKNIQIKDQWQK